LTHFEDLRTAAITKLEIMKEDEENKDIIIDSLVYLKGKLQVYSNQQKEHMQVGVD
jgi:hypothetical protein